MYNKKFIFLTVFFLFFTLSCAGLSKKDLEEIPGKIFYFQKFYCHQKAANNQAVFNNIKILPIDNIMQIMAHKYGIVIDTTEFNNFIYADDPSQLKVGGLVINTKYTWESISKNSNGIEFELYFTSERIAGHENIRKEYYIILKINDEKKTKIYGNLWDNRSILQTVAKDLGYERLNKDSDDIYVNKKNKAQIKISSTIMGPVI